MKGDGKAWERLKSPHEAAKRLQEAADGADARKREAAEDRRQWHGRRKGRS